MKFAFIFGSSAFVVPHGIINYANSGHSKEILRIKSICEDTQTDINGSLLIDANIQDKHGNVINIIDNVATEYSPAFSIHTEQNLIKVLSPDKSLIFEVHQLDHKVAMHLEHNIVAELQVNSPFVAIRISGDFIAGGLHISAENEKLYVNNNGYASSALAGSSLSLSEQGVILQ